MLHISSLPILPQQVVHNFPDDLEPFFPALAYASWYQLVVQWFCTTRRHFWVETRDVLEVGQSQA